jgi:hypothetical protein
VTTINDFQEIRRDGKIIHESMSANDIFALGAPEKIIEIQWVIGSQRISLRNNHGILAKVVAGREFVAANEYDAFGRDRTLSVINSDGSKRLTISKNQLIRGKNEHGEFCWFEPARVESANIFGVVFRRSNDNSMFQFDIDARDGRITAVYPMQ